jgi:hypothetical protein
MSMGVVWNFIDIVKNWKKVKILYTIQSLRKKIKLKSNDTTVSNNNQTH